MYFASNSVYILLVFSYNATLKSFVNTLYIVVIFLRFLFQNYYVLLLFLMGAMDSD